MKNIEEKVLALQMRIRRALPVLLCASILFTDSGCAARYPTRSFLELQDRLKRGNSVYVIDDNGTETSGKFVEATDASLTLDVHGLRHQIDRASVHQVDRKGDSLWNGFIIGTAFGAMNAVMDDPGPDGKMHTGQRIALVAAMGAVGTGIDAAISHRHIIYLAPQGLNVPPTPRSSSP